MFYKGGCLLEHEHLDPAALERMLAVDRTEDQNRNLLHQLAVCPECYEVGGWLLDLYRSGALTLQFGPVDVALARSRAEAPRLWEELAPHSPEERLALVRSNPRFASWGFCELLCREGREVAPDNANQALELAELAVAVADSIDRDAPAEDRWVYQLRALAWACLGNAWRVRGDLPQAETGFDMSDSWWEAGLAEVGDALGYEPVLLNLKASLRMAQRQFPEALELLDRVIEVHLHGEPEHRDPHLAGRALVQRAHTFIELGEPAEAIFVLRHAEGLVDPDRDPRLLLCLWHDLVYSLEIAGRYQEAAALLPQVRSLSETSGSNLDRVRLRWVEGQIAHGLGDQDAARRAFEEVRQAFLADEIVYDAALVSLDLAALAIQQARTSEVRELAREMVAIFRAQDVPREALAAALVFEEAAALDAATVELAHEVAARLRRAWQDPGPRFEDR